MGAEKGGLKSMSGEEKGLKLTFFYKYLKKRGLRSMFFSGTLKKGGLKSIFSQCLEKGESILQSLPITLT